jgi:hypothetical protein
MDGGRDGEGDSPQNNKTHMEAFYKIFMEGKGNDEAKGKLYGFWLADIVSLIILIRHIAWREF